MAKSGKLRLLIAKRQPVAKPAPKAKPAAPKEVVVQPAVKAPAKKKIKKAEKRED